MEAFLFTDIESSTRLWEEHPDEMARALARHDQIMREAIAAATGRLLKTTGDGAIAVFESPADAVRASIAAQEALQSEPWDTTPVQVRMGIHAGQTLSRDDDHFGPVMNRAARIMAAGHGGQVLLSRLAADLAAATDETTFRDLGSHRLKDLTEPEHLFQLVHPRLASEFPQLKTLDARPHNLPLAPTEFVGRSQELAAIHLMLENPATRLLTIAGPGGAGKTRLSLQVAADLVDAYRDGAWFVDLAADTSPADAFETMIRELSLPVSRIGAPLEVLKNRLRDRQLLLVLDNFEQVIAAGAGVGELVLAAPELRVIVTSRETLRVRGEQVYPVPPLSLPHPDHDVAEIAGSEAVQLFVGRATAARPDFVLDESNAGDVAAMCLRLDGLPLAIELAAARLNVFTPSDLLDRLSDRLDVLASGGRDLPDRQRTLWGAIGWSYELLSEQERALFALLSVFSGADLPAVEGVAADVLDGGVVMDELASLVDKSLVRRVDRAGSLRFEMLQMIKEFAFDQLARDPDRLQTALASHAGHYSTVAIEVRPRLEGPARDSAIDQLEGDLDNLRSAWERCLEHADSARMVEMFDSLWALHAARGWYHGAIDLATDLLTALADTDPSADRDAIELTVRVSQARALMAVHGYNLEVEQAFSRALELAESVGTAEDRAPVLRALASYHLQSADIPRSMELGQQLMQMGRDSGNEAMVIEAHSVIGYSLLYFDPATTLDHLGEVIARYDPARHGGARFRLGPDTGVVARIGSAIMLWESGKADSAVAMADDALAFAESLGHPYSQAWAVFHWGYLAVSRGRFDDVLETSQRLAALSDEHDYVLWRTLATVLEGVARTAFGELDEGVALTEQGVQLYRGLAPPPVFWPMVLGLRAGVHAMAGDLARALELVDEAIAVFEPLGLVPPELAIRRSELLLGLNGREDPEAEAMLETATTVAAEMGLRLAELEAHARLVELRRALGRAEDGAAELAELYATFDEGGGEQRFDTVRRVLEA